MIFLIWIKKNPLECVNVCFFNAWIIFSITKYSIKQKHPNNNDGCNFQPLWWIRLKNWQRHPINKIIHDDSKWCEDIKMFGMKRLDQFGCLFLCRKDNNCSILCSKLGKFSLSVRKLLISIITIWNKEELQLLSPYK